MKAKFIYEKFIEKSDPIKDMKIGLNFPEGFKPMFRLKKQYPGMNLPIGTFFGKVEGWTTLRAIFKYKKEEEYRNLNCTAWELDYFEPWVGEFFEKLY